MKKLFTLIALTVIALAAQAEAPVLLFEGSPVQAGKTYETGYTVESFDMGVFVMNNYTQDSELTLRGVKGEQVVVEVEASNSIQFCGIDGTCVPGSTFVKTGVLGEVAGDIISSEGSDVTVKLQIDKITQDKSGKPASEVLPNVTVNVTAYYAGSTDKATATVILTNKSAEEIGGIGAVDAGNYVRLSARRVLSYNVPSPTKLCLYSVTGQLVMGQMIYSTGTVSLDAIPAGMYIFRAGKHTGKILVK